MPGIDVCVRDDSTECYCSRCQGGSEVTRSTKSEVRNLARQVYGDGTGVVARRRFTTDWIVEVSDVAGGLLLSDEDPSLSRAYGGIATRLRAKLAIASPPATLEHELAQLERADPTVGAAAAKLEAVTRKLIGGGS